MADGAVRSVLLDHPSNSEKTVLGGRLESALLYTLGHRVYDVEELEETVHGMSVCKYQSFSKQP
jgi:hypothetical protein